jgi:P-type Cu+ transporter
MATPSIVTTSFLLDNLHCPSCVTTIKRILRDRFGNAVSWVSPNLVTHLVIVEHEDSPKASVDDLAKTLQDSGFEILGIETTARCANTLRPPSNPDFAESSRAGGAQSSAWNRFWQFKSPEPDLVAAKQAHMENCKACQEATADEKRTGVASNQPCCVKGPADVVQPKSDIPKLAGVAVDDVEAPPQVRASLSIGGMTCASCVNAITKELESLPWVSEAAVNLVTNSATVYCTEPGKAQELVDAIEDIGYEASLEGVVDMSAVASPTEKREVYIRLDGMFCARCPERVMQTLRGFGSRLEVMDEPSMENSIIRLIYEPSAPQFTIRHILRAISEADDSIEPSIYHPPTLEEKSRQLRARHLRALLWREILTVIIAIPTFVLGIVFMNLVPSDNHTKHYLMQPWTSGLSRLDVILCLLATPIWLFAADVFHRRAIKEIRAMWRPGSRTPIWERFVKFGSMDMLMSLGTTIAYLSSVGQMIAVAASSRAIPHDLFYFDSVVFLTLFLLAGRLIEAYSKSKTGNAVELLVKLRPDTALLVEKSEVEGQVTRTIPLDQLEHGDVIKVPHGSSPPADGVIIEGESSFDESSLTGESRPVKKAVGDTVFGGTVNKSSVVTLRVTGTGGKSMLDQIVEVVREGQTKRAPVEQVADILTSYFVPVITLIAIVTWLTWVGIGYSGHIGQKHLNAPGGWVVFALQFAIAVFVVACPCGIGLAAPTAIFVGGGLAAKHGVLVKGGGEAFEKAHKVDCVVFDKTGTLTVGGEPQITDATYCLETGAGGLDTDTLRSALKAVEENSSHPIAQAIVRFCGAGTVSADVEQVEEIPGKGMRATRRREGQASFDIAVGNEPLMQDLGVFLSQQVSTLLQGWKSEAKSVALVAVRPHETEEWTLAAALSISDPIREEAAAVIRALTSKGVQVWMLSGDNVVTAKAVAGRVGIDASNVLAEVLPSEKAAKVTYLQATLRASASRGYEYADRRATVAMVGDGINDSPALTAADVGIAIGSGSDVAISSADFVLATSNLTAVLTLLELSRTVFRRIKFNFGWAVVYNVVAIPFAAGCLYAVTTSSGEHIRLDPVWASLAMALSSISVVMSSLSLRSGLPLMGFKPTHVATTVGAGSS